jgi:hypothetical protein
MASRALTAIVEYIRQTAGQGRVAELTDGQLLERFVADRDENAFGALIQRHGPLVLTVCRRVLYNTHDVEDAFQATFLVLVRKAGSIAWQTRMAAPVRCSGSFVGSRDARFIRSTVWLLWALRSTLRLLRANFECRGEAVDFRLAVANGFDHQGREQPAHLHKHAELDRAIPGGDRE